VYVIFTIVVLYQTAQVFNIPKGRVVAELKKALEMNLRYAQFGETGEPGRMECESVCPTS
jgi:hypothetical protein